MQRRQFLRAAAGTAWAGLGALAAGTATTAARAQEPWPRKPIRLVVPFPPGGGTDTTARLITEKLALREHWTLVVDNRPGAGGNIGLDLVAKAAPDGYTIGLGQAANLAINPALYPRMPFDPLKDLTPIAGVAEQPIVLVVRQDSPLRSLADFLRLAKARAGAVSVAQAGSGTVGHLAGEMLARRAGVQLTQVPYKGAGPAMTDLLGGQVDGYFGNTVSVMPQLAAGKIRALAVTSVRRNAAFPAVPTIAEQGFPGFDATSWLGLVGPAGMPAALVARLSEATLKVMAEAEVQRRLAQEGSLAAPVAAAAFGAQMRAEHAKWGALVREAHVKLD